MVLASLLFCASSSMMAGEQNITAATAAADTATLTVSKMTWGGCAKKVKRALSKVEGIKSVVADNKTRKVVITIEDKSKFDLKSAIAAIKTGTGWDAVENKK